MDGVGPDRAATGHPLGALSEFSRSSAVARVQHIDVGGCHVDANPRRSIQKDKSCLSSSWQGLHPDSRGRFDPHNRAVSFNALVDDASRHSRHRRCRPCTQGGPFAGGSHRATGS
jgi:hypothetical protein